MFGKLVQKRSKPETGEAATLTGPAIMRIDGSLGECQKLPGVETVMKNIQIIDGAVNATYNIFQATDDEFRQIFPESGQDLEVVED